MTEKDYTEVTVKEASHDDAGRGIARVSIEVMKKLGLVSGDVIEILGK
jgi:transitional endoplasmic reticulum ATPase